MPAACADLVPPGTTVTWHTADGCREEQVRDCGVCNDAFACDESQFEVRVHAGVAVGNDEHPRARSSAYREFTITGTTQRTVGAQLSGEVE